MKCSCGAEMQWVGSMQAGKMECLSCEATKAFTIALASEDPDILPDGLFEIGGVLFATCRVCGNDYELYCDISEFDLEYSYCGGSPRCCP